MTTGKCSTCGHWSKERHMESQAIDVRTCKRIPQMFDVTGWDDNNNLIINSDSLAFSNDGSAWFAELLTRPDFGCVMYEGDITT